MSAQPQTDSTVRWRRVEDLFHRALELPRTERTAFLERMCADDLTLLTEVLELLHSDSAVGERLATPIRSADADPWLGETLGHYRVLEELGRGGMGVVYLGERTGTGPHARAAIKVVRRNLEHSPALTQFLLERDALARLEHPNIARLLDGGVTPAGIPWLALEYVPGKRLDHFVEAAKPSIGALIKLFVQLCAAVSYVHRNLILHRDLKPGNVMVTPEGTVKLLDFGTLKVLGGEALSVMTQAGMRPVTLRYASPEHVAGGRASTASDVYSLGMMLYRLLAGRLPEPRATHTDDPESAQRAPMSAFFDDLRSGRIAPPSAFATLPMRRELARDLDAIVMKAIDHNPAARYQTPDALAAELTRALEDRPVAARGRQRASLARKFVRRHAAVLWTGAAAALVLAFALALMARETRAARAEQARTEVGVHQERDLAHLLLFDYFAKLLQLDGSTAAQLKTVAQTSSYLDQLNSDPSLRDPTLQLYEVQGYTKLGNVLGSGWDQNLGDVDGGLRAIDKATRLADTLLAHDADNLPLLEAATDARQSAGRIYLGPGNVEKAAYFIGEAITFEQKVLEHANLKSKDLGFIAQFEDTVGDLHYRQGAPSLADPAGAAEHYHRSIDYWNRALKLEPESARAQLGIGIEDWKLGQLTEDPDPVAAASHYAAGLRQIASMSPILQFQPRARRLQRMLTEHLGVVEVYGANPDTGLARMHVIRQQFRTLSQADPVDDQVRLDWVIADANLVDMLMNLHREREAVPLIEEQLPLFDALEKDTSSKELELHRMTAELNLDRAYDTLHQPAAALTARRRVLPQLLEAVQDPHAPTLTLDLAATTLERIKGDSAMEVAIARRSIESNPFPDVDQFLNLAKAERRVGDRPATRAAAGQALGKLHNTTGTRNAQLQTEARELSKF